MVSNIWVAAADNQTDVVKAHIESGAFSANSKDPNGYTPIHAAASYGHTDLLQYLISVGGDINVQDTEGDTPLHHVEDLATARFIVEQLHADYKLKNHEDKTAAEFVEEDGENPELAQYLRSLIHGSDPAVSQDPLASDASAPNVRYTMEEDMGEMTDEQRQKLQEIANSEDPEAALRELVTSAVRDGLAQFKENGASKRARAE